MALIAGIGHLKKMEAKVMNNPSPLRYPGGKSKFYPFIKEILHLNNLLGTTYIEPFAGGAGLALRLLLTGDVKRIIINDYDSHVYAFWYAILNYTDIFCELLSAIPVTVDEWDKQKGIYNRCQMQDLLQLGFATFFLNRTNVSGVLTGGIIGGRKQEGDYRIDARFSKDVLISKIKDIAARKEDITILNENATNLFGNSLIKKTKNTFINFDPPYVGKGAELYKNAFTRKDHISFAKVIMQCKRKWIVTYDANPLIMDVYSNYRIGFLDVSYSVGEQKKAKEYIIFSPNMLIPKSIVRVNEVK